MNIKIGRECAEVDYTTGVHQGDNMSPVLFLFVIQAFLDTLKLKSQKINFAYFPENKNGKAETAKGRLVNQNTKAKGVAFELQSSFYVDDSFFVFQNKDELHEAAGVLNNHFTRLGLKMHLGSDSSKSKSEAMYFPASLKEAKMQTELPGDLTFPDGSRIHFTKSFKYLGSVVTPCLNEDTEIEMRIRKAKSLMGYAKHFFSNKDVDRRIKYQVYTSGPLNALLWGCETWNLTEKNLRKLRSFHHGTIRRILQISWTQVREKHIKNKEVRGMFLGIPDIDAFINRRTAKYIGKVARSDDSTLPKKFLAAWINRARKEGAPQLTCNNSFAKTICNILPSGTTLSSKNAPLKEWLPVAKCEKNWQFYIDQYFKSCKNVDESDDEGDDVDEADEEEITCYATPVKGAETEYPENKNTFFSFPVSPTALRSVPPPLSLSPPPFPSTIAYCVIPPVRKLKTRRTLDTVNSISTLLTYLLTYLLVERG